jgi:DNA-binding sugar fermentation-stimulating protein
MNKYLYQRIIQTSQARFVNINSQVQEQIINAWAFHLKQLKSFLSFNANLSYFMKKKINYICMYYIT